MSTETWYIRFRILDHVCKPSTGDFQKVKDILFRNFPAIDSDDGLERSDLEGKYFPKKITGNDSG